VVCLKRRKAIPAVFLKIIVAVIVLISLLLILLSVNPSFEEIAGKYILKIPYAGYMLEFAKTGTGLLIITLVPCAMLLIYISVLFADIAHNSSKHRKKIIRKRKRRNKRYIKEGLIKDKKAVI